MLVQPATRVYRTWVSDSRRWNGYHPREGDIVIATYPKSGTTWMQQIVGLLIFQSAEPRPVTDIAPWIDRHTNAEPVEAVLARIEAQTHRRFLKSHAPFDGMPIHDEVRYIHVARDGRDACLSYHNHCCSYSERMYEGMDRTGLEVETIGSLYPRAPKDAGAFFRRWLNEGIDGATDGLPAGSWFNFERTYWEQRRRANLLMVHYRDLKADLAGEMRRIAAFLGIEVPDSVWPALVKAATFSEMRRLGSQISPGFARSFVGGADTFFQKGENDRWKGVLADADLADYEAKVRERLPPDCARWLAAGGAGARAA